LVAKVDIPTLQSLLPSLKNDVQVIQDNLTGIQDEQDKNIISNGFDDIKTQIDNYISLNPALANDRNKKNDLENQFSTILEHLNQNALKTADLVSNLVSQKYVFSSKVLTFANKDTANKYQTILNDVLNKSKSLQ
jgi:hypothetical protein